MAKTCQEVNAALRAQSDNKLKIALGALDSEVNNFFDENFPFYSKKLTAAFNANGKRVRCRVVVGSENI